MSLGTFGKQTTLVGPWGGSDGQHWDDGVHTTIRQVEIFHGAGVDSIRFEYDNNGRSVWSEKHGGSGGAKIDKIRLDYPQEYLISLHGHYGGDRDPIFVRSLTFESNKRKYGPYGVEKGTYFSIPKSHCKIVGFLGKSGWYLDAIGAYLEPIHKPIASNHVHALEPIHKPIASNHVHALEPIHKPIAPNSVVTSQQYIAHGAEKYEYSMIQGGLGTNYDFIVAFRQKDDHKNFSPPIIPSHKTYHDLSHTEHKTHHDLSHTEYKPYHDLRPTEHKTYHDSSHPEHKTYHDLSHTEHKPYHNLRPTEHKTYHNLSHTEHKKYHDSSHPEHKTYHDLSHPEHKTYHDLSHPEHKTYHDLSHTEHKKTEVASVVPAKIERVPSKIAKGVVTYGPWGGNGGSMFDDGVVYDGIRQINLSRNVGIVSIRVCYEQNGQVVWGSKNGGTGGFKHDKIVLDYPSEILTHVTGYHGPTMIMGPNVIQSLTFHTTKGKHGPYGDEQGEFFSTKMKEGSMIVGFHGKKGLFLDAIGVHVLVGKVFPSTANTKKSVLSSSPPKSNNQTALSVHSAAYNTKKPDSSSHAKSNNQTAMSAYSSASNTKTNSSSTALVKFNDHTAVSTNKVDNSQWPFKVGKQGQTEEVGHRMVKNPAPHGPGPWGGDGGKSWDDGVFTGIKQIILTQTDAICCIEIEYDRNGQSVWSVKHGGSGGGGQAVNRYFFQVKLDYPHEVLTSITGYYGPIKKEQGTKVVQSLTFHTSRKKYGPFGEELGTYFGSGTTEGKVVGFHGRSSMYLDAIGVHMQHWLGNQKTKPSSWLHR